MDNLNKKVKKAVILDFISRIISQGRSFIVSIFLARLLSPADFGIIGLALSFIAIASIFTNFGLGTSLIQRDNLEEEDYSSVFWLNAISGLGITLLLILFSFFAGWFYSSDVLRSVLICISFSVLINSLSIVQNALLLKKLENKIQLSSSIISGVIAGAIAITMAFAGYGIWSLVASVLIGDTLKTFILWLKTPWRPTKSFSWRIIHNHFKSSKYLFFSSALNSVTDRLDGFVIGKLYSLDLLGIYQRAQSLNQMAVTYSSASLFKILLPTFSHLKNDKEKFDAFAISSLHLVSFVVFMLAGFMYCSADMFILLIYSAKWLQSVEYYKILAYSVYSYPVSAILVNMISGKGENKAFFNLELIKKGILILAFPIGFFWGIDGYLYAFNVAVFVCVLLNIYWVSNIAQIAFMKLLGAIFPYAGILGVAVVLNKTLLGTDLILSNLYAIGLYAVFLCILCFFCKLEGILMFLKIVKKTIKKS